MKGFIVLSFCCLLLALVSYGSALDEEAVKESRCIKPRSAESVGLDMKWYGSVTTWYTPLWSQLDATRTAADLFQRDPAKIGFNEIQPAACILFEGDKLSGWGRTTTYNITIEDNNSITFIAPWSGAKTAKLNYHLTDNKSFVLGVNCWKEDNEASWALLSTQATLEEKVKNATLAYIKSLGLDKKKAVEEDYTQCGKGSLTAVYGYEK